MSAPLKSRNSVRWSEGVCSVVACAFLLYKWLTYKDYDLFWQEWIGGESWNWMAGIVTCLLLPCNLMTESIKWKALLRPLGERSTPNAFKDVCKGYLGAFVTPNRVGEFPCRAFYLPRDWRVTAIGLGGIGAIVQMGVIAAMGIPAFCVLCHALPRIDWTRSILYVSIMLVVVVVAVYLLSRFRSVKQVWDDFVRALHHLGTKGVAGVTLWALLRYLIFCFQFWLMLEFCGVHLAFSQAWMAVAVYYMLVTFTPSIHVAELAVRGSWAVVALSPFTNEIPAVTLSAWLVWMINGVVPLLVGMFIKHTSPATPDEQPE